MAIVQCEYRNKIPHKVLKLVRWLIVRCRSWNSDIFDDADGRTEYATFQLTFSKVRVVIEKYNGGYTVFQLEKTNKD